MGRIATALEAFELARSIFAEERDSKIKVSSSCPIVLLPGFGSSSRVLLPLERRLRRQLRRPVIRMHLGYGLLDIRAAATKVHEMLEERSRGTDFGYVDVVAHSMGGLVALYLSKVLNPSYRIRKVITLGTPHGGTPFAIAGALIFGTLSQALWQMCPGSSLVRNLKQLRVPAETEVIAIEAGEDRLVPRGYARLKPESGQKNRTVDGLGHIDLLHASESLSLVSSLLAA